MQSILVLGAGKSTHHLITHLLINAKKENFEVVIACIDPKEIPVSVILPETPVSVVTLDIQNSELVAQQIAKSTLIISMLPAHLHIVIAKMCLHYQKNLLTASYVSPEMKLLHQETVDKKLLFLNEMGLDPGLDHMSSMKLIHQIQQSGNRITSYQSYCGGLVAPESDNNPWNYKFTWNPRNVVLAGQGPAARYLFDGRIKYIPYQQLFKNPRLIQVGNAVFEGYPNRNSLQYIDTYQLNGIKTMVRGTLRKKNFSKAWDIFIQLGLTDDSYTIPDSENLTPFKFIQLFLRSNETNIISGIQNTLQIKLSIDEIEKINFINFEDNAAFLKIKNATPAQLLEIILLKKWSLNPDDKDMIVMHHAITYIDSFNKTKSIQSQLIVKGENQTYTAMSKTVGLPLAIGAIEVLNHRIQKTGVEIPIHADIYNPILEKLSQHGIVFKEF